MSRRQMVPSVSESREYGFNSSRVVMKQGIGGRGDAEGGGRVLEQRRIGGQNVWRECGGPEARTRACMYHAGKNDYLLNSEE